MKRVSRGKSHPSKTRPGGPTLIRGWKAISEYLAQPASAVQRWAKEGMPVRREGRTVVADVAELRAWLGKEAHAPAAVTISNASEDLVADLRRGLMAVQNRKRRRV